MKTLIVQITDKKKNDFVMELLTSFEFLNVKEKKDFTGAEKKLAKKYKKAFNEANDQQTNKRIAPVNQLPREL